MAFIGLAYYAWISRKSLVGAGDDRFKLAALIEFQHTLYRIDNIKVADTVKGHVLDMASHVGIVR